jgi:hypothetical protein
VFQTAKSVRVVSDVVDVVISLVAAPPLVRLQPPKEYPVREVETLLASDSVDRRRESAETRVAASEAGTDVASVLPSKIIDGFAAVLALADVGIEVSPAIARRQVRTIAVALFDSDIFLKLKTDDIGFPSLMQLCSLTINPKPQ